MDRWKATGELKSSPRHEPGTETQRHDGAQQARPRMHADMLADADGAALAAGRLRPLATHTQTPCHKDRESVRRSRNRGQVTEWSACLPSPPRSRHPVHCCHWGAVTETAAAGAAADGGRRQPTAADGGGWQPTTAADGSGRGEWLGAASKLPSPSSAARLSTHKRSRCNGWRGSVGSAAQ